MYVSTRTPDYVGDDYAGERLSAFSPKRDKPWPLSVCAVILVAASAGCWGVILYVVNLI